MPRPPPPAAPADLRVAARLERLPPSPWHRRVGLIIGSARFFDGFDAITIAYVLPVLNQLWSLTPAQTGELISLGYLGQMVGALFFGWLAQRVGRVPTAIASLVIFTATSLLCALAWNYQSLLALRFVQGLGLGGELPVLHAYINEVARSRRRGRYALLYQLPFTIGVVVAALVGAWIVPRLGWQSLFVLGAAPALLALPMRRMLVESPRWLASRGRFADAERVLRQIEDEVSAHGTKTLPPLAAEIPEAPQTAPNLSLLFRGIYLRRTLTVWTLWFCVFLLNYGISTWMPSIFRSIYKASLEQSLQFGFVLSAVGLVGACLVTFLIDITGRRLWFGVGLLLCALPLLALWNAQHMTATQALLPLCLCQCVLSSITIGLGVYTAEIYPTPIRATALGVASAWQRMGSAAGPFLVGLVLPTIGLGAVFVGFAGIAVFAGVICLCFAVETSGMVLEVVSPPLPRSAAIRRG